MSSQTATAIAHPNIAFIKYWGNRDDSLRLPQNGSISMNLDELETRTQVTWTDDPANTLVINGKVYTQGEAAFERVTLFMDLIRNLAGNALGAQIVSANNFPEGTGIASSASAFAALALAATKAAGLNMTEASLSMLARRGSGSACRSVPGGFVEWKAGMSDQDSYAVSIAPPEHWELVDCIAIISREHKHTGSSLGHTLAGTSPLQTARVVDAPRRLSICREAILKRDFSSFADIVELDSNLMHAIMMTSTPPLFYWQPATVAVIQEVHHARQHGLSACCTVDAGPNVHVLCESISKDKLVSLLRDIPGVAEVRAAPPGSAAILVVNPLTEK